MHLRLVPIPKSAF